MKSGNLRSLTVLTLLLSGCSGFLSACGSEKEAERPGYLPDDVPEPSFPGGTQASNFMVVPEDGSPAASAGASSGQGGSDLSQATFSNMPVELPTVPQGVVSSCFGSQCPSGECEAEPEAGEASCATAYRQLEPGLDSLCQANSNASFCLNLEDGQGDWLWAIKCGGGVTSFELCSREDGSAACESMLGGDATCGG